MNMKIRTTSQFTETLRGHLQEAGKPKLMHFDWEAPRASVSVMDAVTNTWSSQVGARRHASPFPDLSPQPGETALGSNASTRPNRQEQVASCVKFIQESVGPYLEQSGAEDGMPTGHVIVDIDEAVHGSYAGIKDVNKIARDGVDAVAREYRLEATAWRTEPFKAIQHSVVPDSVADLVVNAAVGTPLAYLAMKATLEGVESFQESRQKARELTKKSRQVHARLEGLAAARSTTNHADGASRKAIAPLLQTHIHHDLQQQKDLRLAQFHNQMSGRISIGSCVSGVSIMAKVATSVGMQTGLSIAGGGVNASATVVANSVAAGTAATVAGAASTMIFAPLAAAGAIGLGAAFTKKSSAQKKEFLKRYEPTKRHVQSQTVRERSTATNTAAMHRHADFFIKKGEQRKNFYTQFVTMNKGFLTGSAIYGTGAVGTTVLGGLMLTGAAALLSNPVGWGALTGLGTVGGIIMAANSLQYLSGHQRQHRYDAYQEKDDPELDREFLSTLDVIAPGASTIHDEHDLVSVAQQRRGFDMRAHFFDQISARENRRRNFLCKVANDMEKWQKRKIYSTDDGVPQQSLLKKLTARQRFIDVTTIRKTDHRHSLTQRLNAATWQQGKAFVQGVCRHRDLKQAMSDAQHAKNEKTDRLTSSNLTEWLQDPAHFKDQAAFMLDTLQEQREYMQRKVDIKLSILEQTGATGMPDISTPTTSEEIPRPDIAAASASELAAASATVDFLSRLDRGLERDQIMLAELIVLESEIETGHVITTSTSDQQKQDALALAKERFMCLQTGHPYDPQKTDVNADATDEKFARYMKKGGDAEERHKHLRGMMVDLEMQATEIRALSEQMTENAPAAGSTNATSDARKPVGSRAWFGRVKKS